MFLATKHHVEYLKELLEIAGIQASAVYSSLDQTGGMVVTMANIELWACCVLNCNAFFLLIINRKYFLVVSTLVSNAICIVNCFLLLFICYFAVHD